MNIDIDHLLRQQQLQVEQWHQVAYQPSNDNPTVFMEQVTLQNHYNYELWHQEDLARDSEGSDAIIAQVKRAIDRLNQLRNDWIERLDESLLEMLQEAGVQVSSDTPMNSETPGSIIDRLSINALKIYHMEEQLERTDVDQKHVEKCQHKLAILKIQRDDLGQCLTQLLEALQCGKKQLKVYRQMKMYNDPTLNPVLYSKK